VCVCVVIYKIVYYYSVRMYTCIYVANQAVYIKLPACPSVIEAVCSSGKKGVKKVDVQRVCFYFLLLYPLVGGNKKKTCVRNIRILTG